MYACQCEGLQMGQSNGVLFDKEVSAFRRCPLIGVPLIILSMFAGIRTQKTAHAGIRMQCRPGNY